MCLDLPWFKDRLGKHGMVGVFHGPSEFGPPSDWMMVIQSQHSEELSKACSPLEFSLPQPVYYVLYRVSVD